MKNLPQKSTKEEVLEKYAILAEEEAMRLIEETSSEKVDNAYASGPSAVKALCEDIAHHRVTRIGESRRSPWPCWEVKELYFQSLHEAMLIIKGKPSPAPLPEPSRGHGIRVRDIHGSRLPFSCPKSILEVARPLLTGDWEHVTEPTEYFISTDKSEKRWVLWVVGDGYEEDGYITRKPVAWCRRASMNEEGAAFHLLHAWWRFAKETYSACRFVSFTNCDAVTELQAMQIADNVWADDEW